MKPSTLQLRPGSQAKGLTQGVMQPPQDIQAEEVVLASLLIDKNAIARVEDFLRPEFFYSDQHLQIYQAILGLRAEFLPTDVTTVAHKLKQSGFLNVIGGVERLAQLTTSVSSSANIEQHARIIHQHHLRRLLYERLIHYATLAYDPETDIFLTLSETEQEVFQINQNELQESSIKDGATLAREFQIELKRRSEQKDGLTGVPSGFTSVDRITHGWQNSDLIIIAARPGMGKTSWFLSNVHRLVVDFKIPVAIFSLEMEALQLMSRLFSIDTSIGGDTFRRGNLNNMQWQVFGNSKVGSASLYIDDTPALRLSQLRKKIRRLVAQKGVKILFVDYLQLMALEVNDKSNREQEIAKISRGLKLIAKECNIPVLALSQLSRGVETRGGDKRPQLSDLRDSGSIEQDADIVMFLYRPEYYKISVDEEGLPTSGMSEAIIAKHRNGATGTAKQKFIPQYTKFLDLDDMKDVHSSWRDQEKNNEDVF